MFNQISSLTLAIVLFMVLAGSASNISVFIASTVVLMVATFIINLKRIGLTWPHLLLPMLFLLGIGSVFVVVSSPTIRILFLIAAAVAFYFLEINLGHESHFLQNIYLLSAFALYVGVFALHLYFRLSALTVAMIVFVITYILIVQGFAGFSLPAKKYFHLLTALTMSQAAWGLSLWPTHFIVNSVVLFCIYYIIWIFSFAAFFGRLSWKKIYLQLGMITIVLAVVLGTAAWRPLIR